MPLLLVLILLPRSQSKAYWAKLGLNHMPCGCSSLPGPSPGILLRVISKLGWRSPAFLHVRSHCSPAAFSDHTGMLTLASTPALSQAGRDQREQSSFQEGEAPRPLLIQFRKGSLHLHTQPMAAHSSHHSTPGATATISTSHSFHSLKTLVHQALSTVILISYTIKQKPRVLK